MQLIIMGAPGAGKGTQAAFLVKEYKIPQISTGDMFRAAVAEGSELGKAAAQCLKTGQLVPDTVTVEIVRERLSKADCANGFILDGFPRTVKQADALNKILADLNKNLTLVLNIAVPAEKLISRAVGRRICKDCGATYHIEYKAPKIENICDECGGQLYQRSDDTVETMTKRLNVYMESTRPLIEYYKAFGKYEEVDGSRKISEVSAKLTEILNRVSE